MNDRPSVLGMWYFSMSDMTVNASSRERKTNRTETKSIENQMKKNEDCY